MFRYQDSRNLYDAHVRTEEAIRMNLSKIKNLEFEYQIEKAKRIARGYNKPTHQESQRKKEIAYLIQISRRTERYHNRYSPRAILMFDDAIRDEPEFVLSREIMYREAIRLEKRKEARREGRDSMKMYERLPTARERIAAERIIESQQYQRKEFDSEQNAKDLLDMLKNQYPTIDSQHVPEVEEFTSPEEIPEIEDYGPAPNNTFDANAPEPKPDFSKFKLAVKKGE